MRGIISSFVLSLFFRVGIANATYSPGPRAAMTESDASIGHDILLLTYSGRGGQVGASLAILAITRLARKSNSVRDNPVFSVA